MTPRLDFYSAVNDAWPADLPAITREEARRASRMLARHFGGRPRSRPRVCWIRLKPPFGTLTKGWRRLVHDVSHTTFRQTNRKVKPHGGAHADLELAMTRYVIDQGWLTGTLRPAPRPTLSPSVIAEQKHARVVAALGRWQAKRKRAETAIRKLTRRLHYYERKSRP